LGLFGGPSASGSTGAVQQGLVTVDENTTTKNVKAGAAAPVPS